MNDKYIKDFIDNLSIIKDVHSKSEFIKAEIRKLNEMISEPDESEELTRMEKLNKKLNYSEIFTFQSYLSLKLSFLDTEKQLSK